MQRLNRHFSILDQLCLKVDQALRTLSGNTASTHRAYPAKNITEPTLSPEQKKLSASLMRINHAGEVCAQALYHAQGIVSYNLREQMQQAAIEEGDHLRWCQTRLLELNSHTSYLNPFWYAGSFTIGIIAGLVGDKWSLGFVAETEQQVVKHLENHLEKLPIQDEKSLEILQTMRMDEAKHRDEAIHSGGMELPLIVKKLMAVTSKIMVKIAFWI